MTHPPFRFGLQVGGGPSTAAWRTLARDAERLGYHSLLVPDHPEDDQWGPLVALTVAAEATSRLHVGSLVLAAGLRNATLLAKELVTLHRASGSRLEVGFGAGWQRSDYVVAGVPFAGVTKRLDQLGEAIGAMREASGSEGRPPLVVGGGGDRVLHLAATRADIVSIHPSLASGELGTSAIVTGSVDWYRDRVDWIARCAMERPNPYQLQCVVPVVVVTDDRAKVVARIARASGTVPAAIERSVLTLIGSIEEICATLCVRRAELGIAYVVVHERVMRAFAPVVARLAGR